MTTIVLVRHGETEWNRKERFRGRAEVPLNERGVAQSEATAGGVATRWRPVAVHTSPLGRAAATARTISERFALVARLRPSLTDIDCGSWQGMAPEDVEKPWPELLRAWYEAPHTLRIPGGESLDEVRVRCSSDALKIAGAHAGETVVLVGHTVVNRLIPPHPRAWGTIA
jgi:broad specificity phosphatase PhoE